jgi:outer membrane protein OmpA-like peptidoglycan-associated protein
MGKKKDEGGAPAYMGLFTSLMTVLLAFFILLVSMADSQDAGFYHGVGSVENSLGIMGGLGMMAFAKAAGESGILGVTEESNDRSQRQINPIGEGGSGTTDIDEADVDTIPPGKYISIHIPFAFDKGTSMVARGSKMYDYLKNVSLSFYGSESAITVRVYSEDSGVIDDNKKLAMQRAQMICNILRQNGIDYERLTAIGYANDRYFNFEGAIAQQVRLTNQAAFFYFYKKTKEE